EYPEVFTDSLGCYNKKKFTLYLKDNVKPIFHRPRQVPFTLRDKVCEALDELVRDQVVEPVESSEWSSPIVPVVKPNGKIRICGDYKETLNKYLIVDKYPVPRVEDIVNSLGNGKVWSKLDLSQAYQQLELDEPSQMLTTVNTIKGLFRYKRVPFGVSSSGGLFNREIENQIIKGIPGVAAFFDDIVITGKTETEHLNRLRQVLNKLKECNLTLSNTKCQLFRNKVEFLGYELGELGCSIPENKLKALNEIPIPKDVTQVKSFLGFVNYYSKFLPNMSTVLSPLYELLKKNTKFVWSEKQNMAFQKVKQMLLSTNVLTHYDPSLDIVVSCDSSAYGIGGVIAHKMPDGSERPIAFTSRTLNSSEKNYACIHKEALAIVYTIKQFNQFLYKVIHRVKTNSWSSSSKLVDPELKPYYFRRDELYLENECLMWGYRVVVPSSLQALILSDLHHTHLGICKMKSIARNYVWWPSIDKDIEHLCKKCENCLKENADPHKATLKSWPWPNGPASRIHLDFFGPIEGKNFIVIVDAYSKWLYAKVIKNLTTKEIIWVLKNYFSTWGLPDNIVSDNFSSLCSHEMQAFLESVGVCHIKIPTYHPASNGAAENMVGTVKRFLKKCDRFHVDEELLKFSLSYNSTPHSTTGVSPAELHLGRKLKTTFDRLLPKTVNKTDALPSVSNTVQKSQERQARYYRGGRNVKFSLNQKVLVKYVQGGKTGWTRATVVKCLGPVTYLVQIENGGKVKRHVNQMKTFDFPDTPTRTIDSQNNNIDQSSTSNNFKSGYYVSSDLHNNIQTSPPTSIDLPQSSPPRSPVIYPPNSLNTPITSSSLSASSHTPDTSSPYPDISSPYYSLNSSPYSVTSSPCQPQSTTTESPRPETRTNNANLTMTRSGRVVKPPDRYSPSNY
ncbi:hypothetical protein WDU94_013915, partial [Cyamophila willieti]